MLGLIGIITGRPMMLITLERIIAGLIVMKRVEVKKRNKKLNKILLRYR